MARALGLAGLDHVGDRLLDAADEEHRPHEAEQVLLRHLVDVEGLAELRRIGQLTEPRWNDACAHGR